MFSRFILARLEGAVSLVVDALGRAVDVVNIAAASLDRFHRPADLHRSAPEALQARAVSATRPAASAKPRTSQRGDAGDPSRLSR